jgi:hypothetical protein
MSITSQGWYFKAKINRSTWVGVYEAFFVLLKNYWLRFATGVTIVLAPFFILLWPEKPTKISTLNKIDVNWFLFALILPAFLVSLITRFNITRIYLISYLGFYLITAYFFWILAKRYQKTFFVLITIWLIAITVNLAMNLNYNISRYDFINQWLIDNEQSGDKIIIIPFMDKLKFDRYYTGKTPWEIFYPLNDNKTWDQRIVQNNWQLSANPQNIGQLSNLIINAKRIILISQEPESRSLAKDWLTANGWQLEQNYRPDCLDSPRILVYQKN